jgi:methionine-rich copper-binding protein CopC
MTRRICAAGALSLCLFATLPAHAHALLRKSEPAQRAQLSRPPAAIRLWFNEALEPAFSSIGVLDAAGNAVTHGRAQVPERDPKLLELPLPALVPGQYTVRYQVLSVDGHTVKASFTFRVKDAAAMK